MSDLIMIDDWIDAQPRERHILVAERAARSLGVWVERQPDGTLHIEEDFDMDAMNEAANEEYKRLYADELLRGLAAEGKLREDHVDENGEIVYVEA